MKWIVHGVGSVCPGPFPSAVGQLEHVPLRHVWEECVVGFIS